MSKIKVYTLSMKVRLPQLRKFTYKAHKQQKVNQNRKKDPLQIEPEKNAKITKFSVSSLLQWALYKYTGIQLLHMSRALK